MYLNYVLNLLIRNITLKEEEENIQISDSLVATITNYDLSAIGGDIMEMGIDSILKDGLLKELPIINIASGIWKTGIAIRN